MSFISRLVGRRWQLPSPIHRKLKSDPLRIPMRDGVELLAIRRYAPGAGPQPTVLVRSCYGIAGPFGLIGTLFAERGFQVVLQNCRGIGGSHGVFRPFFDEQNDGEDTVNWIASQPWFSGQLALWGGSYLGNTAWAIANSPAAVRVNAMGLHVTLTNFHDRTYAFGGYTLEASFQWTITMLEILRGGGMNILGMLTRMRRNRILTGKATAVLPLKHADKVVSAAGCTWWQDWMNHAEPGDPWWDPINYGRAATTIPATLMTTGWHDIFLPWQLKDFVAAQRAGRAVRLIVGPWMHADMNGASENLRETLAHFQQQFGLAAPAHGAKVRLFVMGANEWRDYDSWPIPNATPRTYFFHHGGLLEQNAPAHQAVSIFDYDPATPTPSFHGPTIEGKSGSGAMAALERRSDILSFTTEPLTADMDAIGPISAEVYLRSNTEHTDLYLCLCDVPPGGEVSTNVCDGYTRLRPGTTPLLADGRTRRVTVEFWPTAFRFARGHRMRVIVVSGAHPRYARNLGTGEPLGEGQTMIVAHQQILHGGGSPTAITLTVSS